MAILAVFEKYGIQLTHIESKFFTFAYDGLCFHLHADGRATDRKMQAAMHEVRDHCANVEVLPAEEVVATLSAYFFPITFVFVCDQTLACPLAVAPCFNRASPQVPWFPMKMQEIDRCVEETIGSECGGLVNEDHPGFSDPVYIKRRQEIADLATNYRFGDALPRIQYTDEETRVWNVIYDRLSECHKQWACEEFNEVLTVGLRAVQSGPASSSVREVLRFNMSVFVELESFSV